MNNDLISREALKTALANNTLIRDFNLQFDGIIGEIIDNAPTVEYPFYQEAYQTGYEEGKNARPQDEITNEDIQQAIKEGFANGYEMAKAKLAEKLKDRIEESVCKYCQMNKHCELCEISRVFQIITLTAEERKGGAE